jgi:hypothetical protein
MALFKQPFALIGRHFSTNPGRYSEKLGQNFHFPRHKELFNDEYYDQEEKTGSSKMKDYEDIDQETSS